MTQNYDYTPTPFDPLSPLESSSGHSSKSSSSTCMSQDNFVEESKTIKDSDNNRIHQEIKEEMYKQLCAVHKIVKVEPVLEQYVLRELRHLQEYLCLRYPPIMSYLKDQFDEIIECTRAKTRGLSIASPDPRNKPNSIQIQSMPSPMKIASPAKECNAPSPQVSTTSDTGTSRGTNRERSTTSSSISSMPPKKQNKSNTTGDFSMSSSDLDTSEDDEEEQHDKI